MLRNVAAAASGLKTGHSYLPQLQIGLTRADCPTFAPLFKACADQEAHRRGEDLGALCGFVERTTGTLGSAGGRQRGGPRAPDVPAGARCLYRWSEDGSE